MKLEKETIALLKKKKFYIICSVVTKKTYVDENGSCIVVEDKDEAVIYTEKIPNTMVSKEATSISSLNEFIIYGVTSLILKLKDEPVVLYELTMHDMEPIEYLNSKSNYCIHQLMHSSKKKFLRELKDLSIICPIYIEPREPKKYSQLHYSIGIISNRQYLIMFSTLQEYNKWAELQKNEWSPLETTIAKIEGKRRGNGICINPLSDKLILTDKIIKDVLREAII